MKTVEITVWDVPFYHEHNVTHRSRTKSESKQDVIRYIRKLGYKECFKENKISSLETELESISSQRHILIREIIY